MDAIRHDAARLLHRGVVCLSRKHESHARLANLNSIPVPSYLVVVDDVSEHLAGAVS